MLIPMVRNDDMKDEISKIPLEEAFEFVKIDKAQAFGEMLQKSLCEREQIDPLRFLEYVPKLVMQRYSANNIIDDYGPYIMKKWVEDQIPGLQTFPIRDKGLDYEWIGSVYAYAIIKYDLFLSSTEDIEQICKTCALARYDSLHFPEKGALDEAIKRVMDNKASFIGEA